MKRIIKGAISAAATGARFTQTMDSRRGFRTIASNSQLITFKGSSFMSCCTRQAIKTKDLVHLADSISGFRTIIK